MRDLVARKSFLWRKKIDNVLHKWFPQTWISLHSLVSFTTIGYKQCKLNSQWQDQVSIKLTILLLKYLLIKFKFFYLYYFLTLISVNTRHFYSITITST